MLRKLVILGAFTGASASVPIVYQNNPQLFDDMLRSALEEPAPEPEPQRPMVVIQKAELEPAKTRLTGRREMIQADSRGHFSADFRINGRPVEALVDTGATLIAINNSTARRLGINLNGSDFRHQVNTANGTIKAATTMLDDVQFGRIVVSDVQAMVLEDRALSGTLVGMSFLKELSSFRVEQGTLILEQ